VARKRNLRFFLRLWVLSRGLYRSQWRWRRFLGVLWMFRTVRAFLGKGPTIVSTTTLRPGTALYVANGDVPVKVKGGGKEIQVLAEEAAS
jgi:hypothetical protein